MMYPGREADHSLQFTAKVKNVRSYISTPPIYLHGMVLSEVQGLYMIHVFSILESSEDGYSF
jgi:hypothetical protein